MHDQYLVVLRLLVLRGIRQYLLTVTNYFCLLNVTSYIYQALSMEIREY